MNKGGPSSESRIFSIDLSIRKPINVNFRNVWPPNSPFPRWIDLSNLSRYCGRSLALIVPGLLLCPVSEPCFSWSPIEQPSIVVAGLRQDIRHDGLLIESPFSALCWLQPAFDWESHQQWGWKLALPTESTDRDPTSPVTAADDQSQIREIVCIHGRK